jgi:hypothetical protein
VAVHIYTQTIHRTTQITNEQHNNECGKVRAVSRLWEFYPGICLTTEEKARKNLTQGNKNLSHAEKNLSQSIVYIYQNTHTLQNPHKHTYYKTHTRTHAHTHTLQNNIKTPQYKLKHKTYIKTWCGRETETGHVSWLTNSDMYVVWDRDRKRNYILI